MSEVVVYKFKNLKKKIQTAEFWYDLTNGYLSPADFSKDKFTQKAIQDAIDLLRECEDMTGEDL